MFFNRNRTPYQPRDAATNWVNRIITYGLVFFLLYALYTTDTKSVRTNVKPAELNYTPVSWGNYLKVKNLQTGETTYYYLDSHSPLKSEKAGAYELTFLPRTSCDIIINNKQIAAFPPR